MTERSRPRGLVIAGVGVLAVAVIGLAGVGGSDSPTDRAGPVEVITPTPTTTAATDADAGSESESESGGSSERSTPRPGSAAGQDDTARPGGGSGGGMAASGRAPGPPYCGASRYVEEITLQRWATGQFRISLWPTEEGRRADDRSDTTDQMWASIQNCVGPLDPAVTESLRDQLSCHVSFGQVRGSGSERYATGDTYDIESWRPTPGRGRWISTRCGNTLGTDPTTRSLGVSRPDGVPPRSQTTGERS